ncbi:adenosylmethionine--8-amino-7-oxononanoate transaminase [Sulfurirhabdus autotrophica]|uniref:Adenosylmethionine-8-amino-7-oxononanoate aminotransferase n=1 Tax=Sulfurirhabdus autotrophica TaxID=1706046 RepID=A0A4R3Y0J4_9PROT|nr:adenosylmethionine--8-amino-7-oxononanoate transaminase [Sulfurirhabdus autotrophica]TCV84148.1 adenosylmethionine-8-amino-7-oxononanoate aminotransferase [Sulfurirhabdus autotrophica]
MSNKAFLERSLAAVWHPCTQMKQHETLPLVPISRGNGVWLYDFGGNRYLDAVSSWWVNLFGHCNPRINAALKEQLDKLEHVILAGFTHEPVIQLSERLSQLAPGNLGHCFYGSDGASATEIALKMSFHSWRNRGKSKKTGFVSLQNSYHGETLGALSVTDVALFKDIYAPLLRQSVQVPTPDWRYAAAGETSEAYALRCATSLENHISKHHEEIAALILEPLVQCAAGMGMYHPVYLKRAREICDQYEVHLIADEIAVGFGRTGTLFACEQAGIQPDFLCLSKGITGGYLPLSVVMTHDGVYQTFYDDEVTRGFLHSHSYTGNALACRAALATLDIFEQDHVIERNREKTTQINELMIPLRDHPRVKNFRQIGMIWAFEVDNAAPDFAKNFYLSALSHELLLRPIGNTVYFMPPYVITNDEMQLLVERTLEIIKTV